MRRSVAVAVAALGLACAGDGAAPRSDPTTFPALGEVERLAEATPPEVPLFRSFAVVDAWTLDGPLPERVELVPLAEPLPHERALFARIAAGAPFVASPGMRCVAQQLARFQLANDAAPDPQLSLFIGARCGTLGLGARAHWIHGEVDAAASDEALLEAWADATDELLDGRLTDGPGLAGLGFARDGTSATLLLATAHREVDLAPLAMRLPADGRFVLRGAVRAPFERVGAMVSQGELGAADCAPLPGPPLPDFAFECVADPGDPFVWLTLGGHRRGRLLSESLLTTAMLPAAGEARIYRRRFHTSAHELAPGEDLAAVFLAHVNRVRQRLGAPPLVLAGPQSEQARILAPHYFAALKGEPAADGTSARSIQEVVSLGIAAGWKVDGVVARGAFEAPWAPATRDVSRLLSAGLELPPQRAALLDPRATALAVGGVRDDEGGGLAALVGSYAFIDPESYHEVAGDVLGRLIAERAARGRPPPESLAGIDALAMRAAASVPAGASPDRALEELLAQAAKQLRVGVHGFWAEVDDPGGIRFPDALLDAPGAGVAVGVAAHRPPNEPWARFIVLVVSTAAGGTYL